MKVDPGGADQTRSGDYAADVGDEDVQLELDPEGATH